MTTHTPEKVTAEPVSADAEATDGHTRLHRGPVARLLSKVSKMTGEFAEYHYESGVWRNIAL